MKIGIIGLGDIAKKAYLPIVTQIAELDPYFCTRNEDVLKDLGAKYHVDKLYSSLDSLLEEDIEAAFVHAASKAHYKIVKKLLENDIHVYVDKPITYHLEQSKELINIARKKDLLLMTGFNRRYVPTYRSLLEINSPKIIIMQKNRKLNPGNLRKVIMDDFIHVVDTIRYLYGDEDIESIEIDKIEENNSLKRVMITIKGSKNTAIGIMNRDNAITEETVEVMGFKKKRKIVNLTEVINYEDQGKNSSKVHGWNKMEYNRGFVDIIDRFIELVKKDESKQSIMMADINTHKLCERIIAE
ncbi:Gfo/Idh/MocA family oxidoreductase [Halanaerobium sp. Z-7514]|uniref:Gfo/Idh/MocA family oxidoreductase n=1 Tax=Halanaerobium polyolivorans TaxID=2886943 RepID=A0AAW4WYV5_9FIRM|nr:Gfo/Idh/MocA family oxidoreductase [Halanaerobium polyolivorans]MCC3144394.1 Gfo/Idh/MocA family oxidoreductase [Halanaerobium polyolivorans]